MSLHSQAIAPARSSLPGRFFSFFVCPSWVGLGKEQKKPPNPRAVNEFVNEFAGR